MANYYYLMSSLPMLRAEGELPFDYGTFLGMCRSAVSEDRYKILERLTPASCKGPLISEWAEFYQALRRELVFQRRQRLGRQASLPWPREEAISKAVSAAIDDPNPLEAEKALLDLAFRKVDELIGTHYFDDYALMGYALKLRLLERKKRFDPKKGKAELDRILEGLQRRISLAEQE